MIATQLPVVRLPLSRVAFGNIHPVRAIFGHHNSRPLKCLFFSSDFLSAAFDYNAGRVQTHPYGIASNCKDVGRTLVGDFVEISYILRLLPAWVEHGHNENTLPKQSFEKRAKHIGILWLLILKLRIRVHLQ